MENKNCTTLVVTSGKGGVGKTTTTANLGVALALRGNRVLVIDADIGLRNLDVVMGLENRVVYDLVQAIEGVCRVQQAMIQELNKIAIIHLYILGFEDDLENPQLSGQIYSLRYNAAHRWYYCPEMNTQESLLLRNWDSAVIDHSCFAAHTAFKNPFTPADVTPRESIEVRTLVIFP